MNETAAKNLVKTTFENPYSRERFLIFAKNIFKSFDESKAFHARGYVKDKFKKTTPVIKTYERFGTFTDTNNNKIDILAVYLRKDSSLDKARTAQRNFAADYLKQRDSKDSAFVAFVPPTLKNWRLSLVKMDYSLAKSKAGKLKAITELTPARRFSFSVGKDENTHTAQRQLLPVLQKDDNPPVLSDLEQAFNVEVVTKDFFEKYKKLFLDTKEALDEIVAKDAKIKLDFTEKNIDTVDFAKKLLGQIVFLYFLQKKGWFGVARDAVWGAGPKDFLRRLFEKKLARYDNFFNDILEPLFYEALAVERTDDFYSKFNCKIPFLNGGLFDPLGNYDWVHTDIRLPDDLFSNNRKTPASRSLGAGWKEGDTGDGILDVFDRYNFTVKEDEPLEREVAVDPEMLGKVFENLLDVKDRKSKGTYYTPREIVHYMCQESLVNYLTTETDDKVKRDDIETLIRLGEIAVEHDSRVVAHGEETETYKFKLPQSVRNNASLIDESLEKIKVCDPAVGSGAFLVGMMTEVIRARNTLSSYLPKNDRSIYAFKRHAIQNCLYGVDIDPGAVEIAKLRLWLSLIVDEQDIKQIKPLPNLDYKIMQGNSLLEEYEGIKLFDEGIVSASPLDNTKQIEELKQKQSELQREYFRLLSVGELKGSKKQQIDIELKSCNDRLYKLTKAPKVKTDNSSLFDQMSVAKQKADELKKLHHEFFETANKREKDEIKKKIEVLEWDLIETTLREQNKLSLLPEIERFKKANIKPFFLWKLNFSEVFEKNGGFDVVIANPPWVQSKFMSRSDKEMFRRIYLTATGQYDLFNLFIERAYRICKELGIVCFITPDRFINNIDYEEIRRFLLEKTSLKYVIALGDGVFEEVCMPSAILIFQKSLEEGNKILMSPILYGKFYEVPQVSIGFNTGSIFPAYRNNKTASVVDKIDKVSIKFGEVVDNARGVEIGKKSNIVSLTRIQGYEPFLRGEDIDKYVVKNHAYIDTSQPNVNYKSGDLYKGKKILIRKTGTGINAVLDQKNRFVIQVIYIFKIKKGKKYREEFLLGLLNSKLMEFWYFNTFGEKNRKTFPHLTQGKILQFPILPVSLEKQKSLVKLVNEITQIKKKNFQADTSSLESKIDHLVSKLYGLMPEEIEIIESLGI